MRPDDRDGGGGRYMPRDTRDFRDIRDDSNGREWRDERRRDSGNGGRDWRDDDHFAMRDRPPPPEQSNPRYEVPTPAAPEGIPRHEREWLHHLNGPATEEEGELVKLAGCTFKLPKPAQTLWQTLEDGDNTVVQDLVAGISSAEVNELGGPYGSTPLGWAALSGNLTLTQLLLEKKANPNLPAKKGSYPLHMATWNGDHPKIVELLLKAGAWPKVTNNRSKTPLMLAREMAALEDTSYVAKVYHMDEWLESFGQHKRGRAAAIELLLAAEQGDAENAKLGNGEDGSVLEAEAKDGQVQEAESGTAEASVASEAEKEGDEEGSMAE